MVIQKLHCSHKVNIEKEHVHFLPYVLLHPLCFAFELQEYLVMLSSLRSYLQLHHGKQ